MSICSSSENSRTKCFFGISFSILPFYVTVLLSEPGGSVNNHPPAVTGSVFTCPICKSEQSQPALVAFPNWPRVPKRFFSYKIILSSATLKGVISLPFGYVQSNWCADRILFAERAYYRAACLDTWKFRNLNSGQNSYLFLSGNSSLTTAVFCLLALVLFHVMVEHFKLKRANGKGSGSGSWKWPVPWQGTPTSWVLRPQCAYGSPLVEWVIPSWNTHVDAMLKRKWGDKREHL